MLKRKSVDFLSAAICLSAVLTGCAQQDDAFVDDEPATEPAAAETAAQWLDEEPTSEVGGGENCAAVRPSTRCGDPLAPGDERVCRINGRSYTIRAGRTMDPCKPTPVVFDLPSSLNSAASSLGTERFCLGTVCWNAIGSGWVAESDTPNGGFIVVAPERMGLVFGDEQELYRDIISETRRIANVDLAKVYISGASDGSASALRTVCEQSPSYAGASANAGSYSCSNVRKPLPVIAFAAKGDLTYDATVSAAESMARANGCRRNSATWRVFDNRVRDAVCRSANNDPRARLVPCSDLRNVEPTTCQVWDGCRDDVKVVFCDVAPANSHGFLNAAADAHVLYENATQLNTPSVAWRFFREFW
jgi:hypothetical protein